MQSKSDMNSELQNGLQDLSTALSVARKLWPTCLHIFLAVLPYVGQGFYVLLHAEWSVFMNEVRPLIGCNNRAEGYWRPQVVITDGLSHAKSAVLKYWEKTKIKYKMVQYSHSFDKNRDRFWKKKFSCWYYQGIYYK